MAFISHRALSAIIRPGAKELNGPAVTWAFFERQRPWVRPRRWCGEVRLATRKLTVESAFAGSSTSATCWDRNVADSCGW